MFDCTLLDKYGDTVTNFTQWDLNQTLYIEEHGFTTPPQFHFCNKNSEKALVVQSSIVDNVLEVVVPNSLLVEPYPIIVYVYLTENESSKTVEYVQIPVRQRPQPDSFEYKDNIDIIDVQELANEIRELNANIAAGEEARVEAENIRIKNEDVRISAEIDRDNAETDRITSETTRKSNEETRLSNEEARNSAETIRESNEDARISNEDERKTSEIDRVSAEAERVNAENDRNTAETERKNAETERVASENERIENEEGRVTAENERIESETVRQSQEEARQTNTATAIANAENATNRANLAAEACEEIVAGTGFISVTEKGIPNGVATLNSEGKVPMDQLPNTISGEANGIVYDNTTSGLLAQNVQDAIDELASEPSLPDGVTYISDNSEETGELLPVDADTLEGHKSSYFATTQNVTDIIDGTTIVGDSNKLGGKDASEYLTTDAQISASTITTGTFAGNVAAPASDDFSTPHITNSVIVDTKPTVGETAPYPIGTVIRVRK